MPRHTSAWRCMGTPVHRSRHATSTPMVAEIKFGTGIQGAVVSAGGEPLIRFDSPMDAEKYLTEIGFLYRRTTFIFTKGFRSGTKEMEAA